MKSKVWVFVDNTEIHAITDQADILQDDINNLMTWADIQEIKFNADKYKIIHSGHLEHNYIMDSCG